MTFVVFSQVCVAEPTDTVPKQGLWKKILNYFSLDADSAKVANPKKFSVSILGGPSYASDSKFNFSLAGIVEYRLNGCDTIQPSNAMVTANITTAGFWKLSGKGTMYFPEYSKLFNYELTCEYAPRDFWGMGYDHAIGSRKTKLHQQNYRLKGELLFRLRDDLYLGPMLQLDYVQAGKVDDEELLEGQDKVVHNVGVGLTLQYDSRDLVTNAFSGAYIYLNQTFRPKFMWNRYAFSTTDFKASFYHKAWRGAVIASQVTALFNFGNPSWAMMAQMGDVSSMRGYYTGRYRDKHMTTAQVELRQYIYRRFGAVAWGGAGCVFRDSESFKHWVPNYGLGLRWEFRRRMNVRLDYGFGHRGQSGFMFSINEAF